MTLHMPLNAQSTIFSSLFHRHHKQIVPAESNVSSFWAHGGRALPKGSLTLDSSRRHRNAQTRAIRRQHSAVKGILQLQMAEVQIRMKNSDKAFELWDEALQIQQKKYGPRHWIVAESLARRGMEHASQERWYEAALDLEKAVHTQKDRLNEMEHPQEDLLLIASKTLLNLGKAHFQMGHVDEALANMNDALAIRLKVHGKHHHEVARVHSIIGDVHRHRREYEKAHASYHRALDAYKRAGFPDHHPEVVWARKRALDRNMLGKRFWANAGETANV